MPWVLPALPFCSVCVPARVELLASQYLYVHPLSPSPPSRAQPILLLNVMPARLSPGADATVCYPPLALSLMPPPADVACGVNMTLASAGGNYLGGGKGHNGGAIPSEGIAATVSVCLFVVCVRPCARVYVYVRVCDFASCFPYVFLWVRINCLSFGCEPASMGCQYENGRAKQNRLNFPSMTCNQHRHSHTEWTIHGCFNVACGFQRRILIPVG